MAVVRLTYEQEELVNKSARKYGFRNFDVDANIGTFKGDNYLGVITTITIKEKGNTKNLHFILKSAHTNEMFRIKAPIAKAFAREAYVYNTVLPRFYKLQQEKNISNPFTGSAEYYGCCLEDTKESILLENLKENGYKLWDRKVPMNDDHVVLVFSEYARFHAASLAFRQLYPQEFDILTKDMVYNCFESEDVNMETYNAFIDMYFKSGFSGAEGNDKAKKALERLQDSISTVFLEDKSKLDKSEQVIVHGDCWCNNMLFKYGNNNTKPTNVCFIDWQLSKLGSPVLDLSYFFSVCSSKEVIHQLEKYLNIYHKILTQNLQEYGCDPEKVFSFETLLNHWKKYSKFGVFMAMIILKIMLSDPEEALDMSGALENGQEITEAFDFNISRTSEFKTRLCDLVEFMSDNNYI